MSAAVSSRCPEPKGRFPRVTHPCAAPGRNPALDLHVLGAPPAFVLSQDQTLSFIPAPTGTKGPNQNPPTSSRKPTPAGPARPTNRCHRRQPRRRLHIPSQQPTMRNNTVAQAPTSETTKPTRQTHRPGGDRRGYRHAADSQRKGELVTPTSSSCRRHAAPWAGWAVDLARDASHGAARPASPPDDRFASRADKRRIRTCPSLPPIPAMADACFRSRSRPLPARRSPPRSCRSATRLSRPHLLTRQRRRCRRRRPQSPVSVSPPLAEVELRRGDTLLDILQRAGIGATEAHEAVGSLRSVDQPAAPAGRTAPGRSRSTPTAARRRC